MRFKTQIEGNIFTVVDLETNEPKANFSLSALKGLVEILGEDKAKSAIITIVESYYADLSKEEIQAIMI
jgi:hypothetical protein